VFSLDAGTNYMAFDKNGVLSFNGGLYFHLFKNYTAGIVTRLSDLVSSSLITMSTPTYTLNENITQNSNASTQVFINSYPLTSNTTTYTNITLTLTGISPLKGFDNKTFSLPFPSSPQTLNVEAPCTSSASSFDYTLTSSLPPWLACIPTGITSTQTFTIEPSSLTGNLVSFSGELKNTYPYSSETVSRFFDIVVYRCPDPECT